MPWGVKKPKQPKNEAIVNTNIVAYGLPKPENMLITIDFETFYSIDYTLRKLSTSEYVRDKRFKTHMVAVKINDNATKVFTHDKFKKFVAATDWTKCSVLCHNTAFDGFILSHHYGVVPDFYLDTLCMARGLHRNDIRGDLNSVAAYYNAGSKKDGTLAKAMGVLTLPKELFDEMAVYCAQDVDLTYNIFHKMLKKMPTDELMLIDMTMKMFCDPVLEVDEDRVKAELAREIAEKERKLFNVIGTPEEQTQLVLMKGRDGALEFAKSMVSGTLSFIDMLKALGVPIPMKNSKTTGKLVPALAITDKEFVALKEHPNPVIRDLVECRMSVRSTTNETRAERFLRACQGGMKLPILLLYYGAHTGRFSGGNRMNPQNLKRGGELRKSILAPRGHHICVADSGQIEARITAWLAQQHDLVETFRRSDAYEASQAKLPENKRKIARGDDRDAYCKFGDEIYGREITKDNKLERFVGKTCILGLGYQMGAARLQVTLAQGVNGPAVYLEAAECERLVSAYRKKNYQIVRLWKLCERIIEDMYVGREGSYMCLSWGRGYVRLPNGMYLQYPHLKKHTKENGFTEWEYAKADETAKLYGGLLCENIVQALARIIITGQMLIIGKHYRIVTMTHDEIVTIAKTKEAEKCFKFMHQTMSTTPEWCQGLPLTAEGGHAPNYSK